MTENVQCPSCGRQLQADGYHGRKVRCPACQNTFVVGADAAITAQKPSPPPLPPSDVQPGLLAELEPSRRRRPAYDEEEDDFPHHLVPRGDFRPADGLVLALKILLIFNLVVDAAMLGSNFLQYLLAGRLKAGAVVMNAEVDGNDARQLVLGLGHLAIYIATIIIFVMWFYRAHANLEPLGARRLTYSSGWAAGCWFVPFLNLVRPIQIAQEIWRNSDPAEVTEHRGGTDVSANSTLLGVWWALWITTNVISNISFRMAQAVNSPQTLLSATLVGMVADVASILLTVVALAVVSTINARQTARAKALVGFRDYAA
jgi:Domain of unknown function (DUF4328)